MSKSYWARSSANLEETKRVARLLDIIARISTRPKTWTRRALAQAYEISERRIQDDLSILVHRLGLPLAHSAAGYYLTQSQSLPSVTFSFGEAIALLLSANVGGSTVGVDPADLAAALQRLKGAFPPELQSLLHDLVRQREESDSSSSRRHILELLQEAIATTTRLRIHYLTASRDGAATERVIEPYALIPYVRSFHLVAYCHSRSEVRIFKVDRIQQLQPTGQRFQRPADFDIGLYLGESWGLMRGVARAPEAVRILFRPRAGRWVSEERWHPGQHTEWQADGRLLFSLRVAITPEFVRWVLYYGSDARVLEPAWLAEEVRKEAQSVAEAYGERPQETAT